MLNVTDYIPKLVAAMARSAIEHADLAKEPYPRSPDAVSAGGRRPPETLSKLVVLFGRQSIKDSVARLSTEGLLVMVSRKPTCIRPLNRQDGVRMLNGRLMMKCRAVSDPRHILPATPGQMTRSTDHMHTTHKLHSTPQSLRHGSIPRQTPWQKCRQPQRPLAYLAVPSPTAIGQSLYNVTSKLRSTESNSCPNSWLKPGACARQFGQ